MATKAQKNKSKSEAKYETRKVNRCFKCGRRRSYLRDFGLCRICFREKANRGEIPGVRKSSW